MYFISDTHFFHDKIRTLANRPFSSMEEMNEMMVINWNSVIGANDIVYHLGDFAYGTWKGGDVKSLFSRLNGRKILIRGNHDHSETLQLPWENVYHMHTVKYNGSKIVLCHYPMIEWDGSFHGSYHFHGHTHQVSPLNILNDTVFDGRFKNFAKNWRNVSVEVIDYTPMHIDELIGEK